MSGLLGELVYEVDADTVAQEIVAQADTQIVVAEVENRVEGFLVLNTRRQFHRAGLVASIGTLVVAGERRSEGVGEALVRTDCNATRQRDAQIIEVNSDVSRVDARRFYERLGFEVVSHHFRMNLDSR